METLELVLFPSLVHTYQVNEPVCSASNSEPPLQAKPTNGRVFTFKLISGLYVFVRGT
jgi:hypothetical protein